MNIRQEGWKESGEDEILQELVAGRIMQERRSILKKGAIATAALAMMTSILKPTSLRAQMAKTDVQMLQDSYVLELKAVNTYKAAAGLKDGSGAPYVDGAVLSVASTFIADHTVHAQRFRDVLVQLGASIPSDTTDTTLGDFPPGPNSMLTSLPGILRYALAVEVYAAKLWYQYFKDATDLRVKRVFADIAPNEAAHAALLRATLKFVLGTGTDHDNADPGKAVVPYTQLSYDAWVF